MALDVPADDWRWTVAGWPHARWKAWHDRVTEAAPWGSTVEEIERARWEAF